MTNPANKDISVIIVIDTITSNNLYGVTAELKNLGYINPYGQMNVYEAKTALYQLYLLNPNEFWDLLQRVPFNYEKTDISTCPSVKEKFRSITTEINGVESNSKDWWNETIDSIREEGADAEAENKNSKSTCNSIPLWAIAVIIILMLIIIFKK